MIFFKKKEMRFRHKDILAMIKQKKGHFILAGLCMVLISATTSAMGYLLKPVIDQIFVDRNANDLILFPIVVVVVFLVKGLATYGQEYFMNYVAQDIIRQLRNKLYDRIQDLPISFFQKERTGVLMSRITNDVNVIKSMVSNTVTSTLRDTSTIIGLSCVIFYMNWRLALISFIILPIAYFPVFELGRRVRKVSTGCQEAMGDMSAIPARNPCRQ